MRPSTMLGNVFVSPTRPQWDRRSWNTNAAKKRIPEPTLYLPTLLEHAPASVMRLLLWMVKARLGVTCFP